MSETGLAEGFLSCCNKTKIITTSTNSHRRREGLKGRSKSSFFLFIFLYKHKTLLKTVSIHEFDQEVGIGNSKLKRPHETKSMCKFRVVIGCQYNVRSSDSEHLLRAGSIQLSQL